MLYPMQHVHVIINKISIITKYYHVSFTSKNTLQLQSYWSRLTIIVLFYLLLLFALNIYKKNIVVFYSAFLSFLILIELSTKLQYKIQDLFKDLIRILTFYTIEMKVGFVSIQNNYLNNLFSILILHSGISVFLLQSSTTMYCFPIRYLLTA